MSGAEQTALPFGFNLYPWRGDVHPLHDPVSVHLDRPFGRAQCKRNPFVDLASNHQVENLPLMRGQRSKMSAQEVQLPLELS